MPRKSNAAFAAMVARQAPAKQSDDPSIDRARQGRRRLVDLSRMREVLRSEGPGGFIMRALGKTVRPLVWFERVAFYEVDLTQPSVRLSGATGEVEFMVATPDDLLKLHSVTLAADFGMSPQTVELCLARSHVALLCLHAGVLVAIVWLAFNAQMVSEIGRSMQLGPGEVLSYNAVTHPACRGRGIGPQLSLFADEYARQHGASRRIIWRRLDNAPAVRVADKLGQRLFAVATAVRVRDVPHAFVLGLNSEKLRPLFQRP